MCGIGSACRRMAQARWTRSASCTRRCFGVGSRTANESTNSIVRGKPKFLALRTEAVLARTRTCKSTFHMEGYTRAVLTKGKLLIPGSNLKYPKFYESILNDLDCLYGDESDVEEQDDETDVFYDGDDAFENDATAAMLEMQDILGYGSDDNGSC